MNVRFEFTDHTLRKSTIDGQMQTLPRAGERVNAYGAVSGVVQLVTWQIEDEGITALIAVRV